jgi:hypothetical protein
MLKRQAACKPTRRTSLRGSSRGPCTAPPTLGPSDAMPCAPAQLEPSPGPALGGGESHSAGLVGGWLVAVPPDHCVGAAGWAAPSRPLEAAPALCWKEPSHTFVPAAPPSSSLLSDMPPVGGVFRVPDDLGPLPRTGAVCTCTRTGSCAGMIAGVLPLAAASAAGMGPGWVCATLRDMGRLGPATSTATSGPHTRLPLAPIKLSPLATLAPLCG